MKVLIVGPGAIGTLFAYHLAKKGVSVDVVTRNSMARDFLRRRGFWIKYGCRAEEFNVSRILLKDEIPSSHYDLIVIAVKSYDFISALYASAHGLRNHGILVSVQNGLGPLEEAEKLLGPSRVLGAVITYGITRIDIGKAEVKGVGEVIIGPRSRSFPSERLLEVESLLRNTGLKVHAVEDIEPYRWLKLLVNAGINPITALLRKPNKVIVEDRVARSIATQCVLEGLEVAKKLGIELPKDPVEEMLRIARITGNNYSSMLQDLLRGSRTEIDYINGKIVELGEKLGVETPINRVLYIAIKGLESWRR